MPRKLSQDTLRLKCLCPCVMTFSNVGGTCGECLGVEPTACLPVENKNLPQCGNCRQTSCGNSRLHQ